MSEIQQIIYVFVIEQIQWKLMTDFFNRLKKIDFGSNFDPFFQCLRQNKLF